MPGNALLLMDKILLGMQNEIKLIVTENPDLLGEKVRFIDRNDREMECTAYQRALWEGDWYLFEMLEKHMSDDEITDQRRELIDSGLGENGEYGSSFDFQPFKNAFSQYIKSDNEFFANPNPTAQECEALNQLWKTVWAEQAKLPAFFIHEYLDPNSPFFNKQGPQPESADRILVRNAEIKSNGITNIFTSERPMKFGVDFGLLRSSSETATEAVVVCRDCAWIGYVEKTTDPDFAALSFLIDVTMNKQQDALDEIHRSSMRHFSVTRSN